MISFIITILVVVSLLWLGYHVFKKFREADGTFWDRLLSGFKDSATVLVAGATYVGGAVINLIITAANAANAPEVAEAIRSLPAEYVGYGMMGLAGLVFIARLRSL